MEELSPEGDIMGGWLTPVLYQWVVRMGSSEYILLLVREVEVVDR